MEPSFLVPSERYMAYLAASDPASMSSASHAGRQRDRALLLAAAPARAADGGGDRLGMKTKPEVECFTVQSVHGVGHAVKREVVSLAGVRLRSL